MNKISKKIVALATMAAFVLTLVPAAAFAAPKPESTKDASAQASQYRVVDNNGSVDINDEITTEFVIKDVDNKTTDKGLAKVRVWATDASGKITDAATFTDANDEVLDSSAYIDNVYIVAENGDVKNGEKLTVSFSRDGKYTLHAAVGDIEEGDTIAIFENSSLQSGAEITVDAPVVKVATLAFWGKDGSQPLQAEGDNDKVVVLNLNNPTQRGDFEINGVDTYTIEGYAYQKDGSRATNTTLNLSASRGNDVIELTAPSVTTDENGFFKITFKMHDPENANIYVKNDDVNYTIRVLAENGTVKDIDTVKDGGYVLAGTDDHWTAEYAAFSDAVQFEITDNNNEVVTDPTAIANEPAALEWTNAEKLDHVNFVSIEGKPNKSDLDARDIVLAYENGVFTLKYLGDKEEAEQDLIPGQYTVKVGLISGMNATATFNVAEYGTTQDLVLDMTASDYNFLTSTPYDNPKTVTDEVMLGQYVYVDGKYVDENGIKIDATDVEYGFDGDAVVDTWLFNGEHDGAFLTYQDEPANDSLLGTVIKVKAFSKEHKQLVETELTVVDSYNTYSLEFDNDNGPANKENKVTVSTVDADGNVGQVRGTMSAYIADQSNEDANIDIETGNVSDGKGTLTIYSDKETTVDIVVAVKAGTAIYAGTLEYTVGQEDPYKDKTVVMTIGSTDYVVNNEIVVGDAAPYVDSNWRTMVPIRALAESFDADVDFDNDARTVTINYDETEIVMTIGEETYTINGEEQTMDTAPVIGDGDRAYVPIRFTAEAMGYTVTPLYDAETGLTASVVFQK